MKSVLLIGQSNMAGRGFLSEVMPICNENIFMLRNDFGNKLLLNFFPNRQECRRTQSSNQRRKLSWSLFLWTKSILHSSVSIFMVCILLSVIYWLSLQFDNKKRATFQNFFQKVTLIV